MVLPLLIPLGSHEPGVVVMHPMIPLLLWLLLRPLYPCDAQRDRSLQVTLVHHLCHETITCLVTDVTIYIYIYIYFPKKS